MLGIFKRKKSWIRSEQLINSYDDFFEVDYGITWINPQDIIGLSLDPRKIRNDVNMQHLRRSVNSYGWSDRSASTLHLYKLPNGKLTVGAGGNYRAYLANELKIPKIRALVTIMIPENLITEDQKTQLEDFKRKEREFDLKAKEINDYLITKGAFRDKYEFEEAQFDEYCELATRQDKKRENFLLEIADGLNYIPEEWKSE